MARIHEAFNRFWILDTDGYGINPVTITNVRGIGMLIDHSFVVNRSPEEVFDYFANVENVPEWANNIKSELFTTDGGPHLGAEFREDARLFGFPVKTEWKFVAYEPPQRFIVHSDSLTIETTCIYTFDEMEAGTRVYWQYDSELHKVFKAAAPLLPGILLRLHQRQFRVAKEILEVAA